MKRSAFSQATKGMVPALFMILLPLLTLALDQPPSGNQSSVQAQHQLSAGAATTQDSCFCGAVWGDVNNDGTISPADAVIVVWLMYKCLDAQINSPGENSLQRPAEINCGWDFRVYPPGWNCPRALGDWNCDGSIHPTDAVVYLYYVYKGVDWSCPNPCGP